MALALEAHALATEARAKYEASLQTLRSFIADFPAITQRVEEHDERLKNLETRFADIRVEISDVIAETKTRVVSATKQRSIRNSIIGSPTDAVLSNVADRSSVTELGVHTIRSKEASSPSEPRLGGGVSFSESEVLWRYDHQEHDDIIPGHGHWLPHHAIAHRNSFEQAQPHAKQLGGRVLMLQPEGIEDVDSLECIMIEPMGKILSPSEYVSTGLVICLDGSEHEHPLFEEYGEVLKASKLLDSGISFALPDVSTFADAGDLERVIEAVLQQGGFQRCILAGKGWGAQMVTEIAGRPRLSEQIDGVVIVAPESPVPTECRQIEVPVMMIWAQDDEVSEFQEIYRWAEELGERRAPTFVKDLEIGGHHFGQTLKQGPGSAKEGETAQQVLHFTVSCLLIGLLIKDMDEAGSSGSLRLSEPCDRLCHELPYFIAGMIGGDAEEGVAAAISGDTPRVKRRMDRLTKELRGWIKDGMVERCSATE